MAHRLLYLIRPSQYERAQYLLAPFAQWYWLGEPLHDDERNQKLEPLSAWLGSEIDCLLYNATVGIKPDELALVCGLVRGGGLILIYLADHYPPTPFNLYWQTQFSAYRNPPWQTIVPPPQKPFQLNAEQKTAVQAVLKVAFGHRNRPLFIIADRGRGKSTVLGEAAKQILASGRRQHIIVTAPQRQAVNSLWRQAGALSGLKYQAVDQILQQKPKTDLLMIDEAAAIPIHLLKALIRAYSRVVLTSTVHGYEGSGQGLRLRLMRSLDQIRPQWQKIELKQPVRWSAGDPVETWLNELLLLNARADCPNQKHGLHFTQQNKAELIQQKQRLQAIFALLLEAHYRTTPNDLQYLLDDDHLQLWTAQQGGRLVAVALTALEPPLTEQEQQAILSGHCRPRQNRLAQALALQCHQPQALSWRGLRLVRIAVCPELQGQGIGSALIQYIEQQGWDYLGSLFGARPELIRFWRRLGWSVLRLGYKKQARSGEYSALVLKGLSPEAQSIQKQARRRFEQQFPLQLGAHFQDLTAELIRQLLYNAAYSALSRDQSLILEQWLQDQSQSLDCLNELHHWALLAAAHNDARADELIQAYLQYQRIKPNKARLKTICSDYFTY